MLHEQEQWKSSGGLQYITYQNIYLTIRQGKKIASDTLTARNNKCDSRKNSAFTRILIKAASNRRGQIQESIHTKDT
jgi:hypothetical protein